MFLLNIFNNENLLLAAEILVIVTGSMLLGILLSYLQGSGARQKLATLQLEQVEEQKQSEGLRDQISQLTHDRSGLLDAADQMKTKISEQARTIFNLQQQGFQYETDIRHLKNTIEQLSGNNETYQQRIDILQQELEARSVTDYTPLKTITAAPARANYDHVSKLLGRQVTENDLTIIAGIGPKTSALLQTNGIRTWSDLANSGLDDLRRILVEEGGVYKNLDPTHWPKQALMALLGEWRKLRVYQQTLKKHE